MLCIGAPGRLHSLTLLPVFPYYFFFSSGISNFAFTINAQKKWARILADSMYNIKLKWMVHSIFIQFSLKKFLRSGFLPYSNFSPAFHLHSVAIEAKATSTRMSRMLNAKCKSETSAVWRCKANKSKRRTATQQKVNELRDRETENRCAEVQSRWQKRKNRTLHISFSQ